MFIRHADLIAVERSHGIVLPGAVDYLSPEFAQDCNLAFDAQPTLITTGNSGIPAYLTNFVDPELIRVLVTPMRMAEMLGEAQKGDWLTDTATFQIVESTGETSTYGDFSENGSTGANFNYVQRQSFHYQTMTQWGEREAERAGLAKIAWASELNVSAALVLNKFQNKTYAYGVDGLLNYGLLNDPSLSAALQPGPKVYGAAAHGPWITAGVVTATPNEIVADITSMFYQVVRQSGQNLDLSAPFTLAMSGLSEVAMTANNSFNVTVADVLRKVFPNITFKTAPEYSTTAGELVQLFVNNIDGQDFGTAAFTEKMRAHTVVPGVSSWKQKKSQGTWGSILRMPLCCVQMLGV
jgi:hypothetical protein